MEMQLISCIFKISLGFDCQCFLTLKIKFTYNIKRNRIKNTNIMPRRCVVPNCSSNCQNYKKNDKSSYVSTFLFPANEEKLNLWLKLINTACNSDIKEVTKCSGICIKHFEDQYILTEASAVRPDGSVLTVPLKRTRLSPDAIPTIFVEEKDFVNTKAAKRKFVKDQNKR